MPSFFYPRDQKSAEERAKEQALLREQLVAMCQAVSLLRSPRFAQWLEDTESRFDWATPALFARLERDLLFQTDQALRGRQEGSTQERLKRFAGLLEEATARLEQAGGFKLTQKERHFAFPRAVPVEARIIEFMRGLPLPLKDTGAVSTFYLENGLRALRLYCFARHTLTEPVPNAAFEQLLAKMDEGYLLKGYPHDILAHDAEALRKDADYKGLLINKEYCSTFLFGGKSGLEEEDFGNLEGFRVVSLEDFPRKRQRASAPRM